MAISEVNKIQSLAEFYGYGSHSIHTDILLNRLFALCNLGQEWPWGRWKELFQKPVLAFEEVGMLPCSIHTAVIFTWCVYMQCADTPACLGKRH